MTNQYQADFDRFIFATERDLTDNTARLIAKELGVNYTAEDFDLP